MGAVRAIDLRLGRGLGEVAAAALAAAGFGALLGRGGLPALVVAALFAAVVGVVIGLARPQHAFAVALATMVAIPFSVARGVGPILIEPTVIALWLVAVAMIALTMIRRRPIALGPIEFGVALFAIANLAAVIGGARDPIEFERQWFIWLAPLLATRLITSELDDGPELVARLLVGAALVLVPFVAFEAYLGVNPFSVVFPPPPDSVFGADLGRLGGTRVQASFGHPLALAMGLASAAVLAAALSLDADSRAARRGWSGAALVLTLAQSLTLARTGWLILAVGGVVLFATRPRRFLNPGALTALAVLALAFASLGVFGSARALLLDPAGEAGGEAAASADYRDQLISYALTGDVIEPFGRERPLVGPGANRSLDNEFVVQASRWGWVSASMLAVIGLIAAATTIRLRRLAAVRVALPALAFANLAALTVVALLTQQQLLVWILVAAAAGTAAIDRRERRESRTAAELLSVER